MTGRSPWRATAAAAAAAASGSPRYSAERTREVVVEEHAERDPGRDLELGDDVVADGLEVLAQRADGVAVRRHEDGAALCRRRPQVGHDGGRPVGHHAAHDVLQALGAREVGRVEVPVARVAGDVVGVVGGQGRGRGVVAAAPEHELLLAELLLDLGLVLALEVPVVALVEAPVPPDRQPAAPGGGQGDLGCADGAGQHRGVEDPQVELGLARLGGVGASARSSPPALASASPAGVRSTSTQPVKRFSAFQVDWPWRSRTRSSTNSIVCGPGRRAVIPPPRGPAVRRGGRPSRTPKSE